MNGEAPMTRDYTGNQRGEVVTGVIVVIMCLGMMIFGGMGMMHGGHRHSDDRDKKVENKHDHQKEGMHNTQNNSGESSPTQDEESGSR
jgi:hypothetical protein